MLPSSVREWRDGGSWLTMPAGRVFVRSAHGDGPTTRTAVLTLTWDRGRVVKVVRTPARLQGGQTFPILGGAGDRERARQEALRDCTGLTDR